MCIQKINLDYPNHYQSYNISRPHGTHWQNIDDHLHSMHHVLYNSIKLVF